MQITKHKVVAIDYRLTDDQGELIDSSEETEPLAYLHGVGALVTGLEDALEGKQEGADLEVALTAAEAYGERREDLCSVVAKELFDGVDELEVGMQFSIPSDDDDEDQFVLVTEITDDTVTIDGNHPLAGVDVVFTVSVIEVRDATAEEISHGHAHEPDDGGVRD